MKKVCAAGPTVRGIDIYHGDMISDIRLVKEWAHYAFLKAFEYKEDPRFQSRWKAMKVAGIMRGAYDFFHPSRDPMMQAERFLEIVGPLESGDLPMVLDWESTDGVPAAKDREAALIWLNKVEKETGLTPIIYAGPYFLDALKLDGRFSKHPLWVAHYTPTCPLVPAPWASWKFWQNSESGKVPGMVGHCDTDYFNGNIDQLKAFAKG